MRPPLSLARLLRLLATTFWKPAPPNGATGATPARAPSPRPAASAAAHARDVAATPAAAPGTPAAAAPGLPLSLALLPKGLLPPLPLPFPTTAPVTQPPLRLPFLPLPRLPGLLLLPLLPPTLAALAPQATINARASTTPSTKLAASGANRKHGRAPHIPASIGAMSARERRLTHIAASKHKVEQSLRQPWFIAALSAESAPDTTSPAETLLVRIFEPTAMDFTGKGGGC